MVSHKIQFYLVAHNTTALLNIIDHFKGFLFRWHDLNFENEKGSFLAFSISQVAHFKKGPFVLILRSNSDE